MTIFIVLVAVSIAGVLFVLKTINDSEDTSPSDEFIEPDTLKPLKQKGHDKPPAQTTEKLGVAKAEQQTQEERINELEKKILEIEKKISERSDKIEELTKKAKFLLKI